MTAEIIQLGDLDEGDVDFSSFVEDIKKENVSAIFLLEKEDGTITVGCNYKDKRDLVFAMYRLHKLAESIVQEEV
jgi:hypothetical protein